MRMKKNKAGAVFSTLVLGSLGLFLSACPQSDGTAPAPAPAASTVSYLGTSAPGDVWTVSFAPDGTFTVVNTTDSTTYSGTYSSLASGYTALTITSPAPATGYAKTVSNTATLVWLGSGSTAPIVAAVQGDCPTSSTATNYNFVRIPSSAEATWTAASTGYGTMTADFTSAANMIFTVINKTFSAVPTVLAADSGWSCTQGIISKGTAQMGVTASGIFLRDDGPSAGGSIGVVQPTTAVAGTIATDLAAKNFIGFQWNKNGGTPVTEAIKGKYLALNASTVFDDGTGTGATTTYTCNTASVGGIVTPALGCILGYSVNPVTDAVLAGTPGLLPLISEVSNGLLIAGFYAGNPGAMGITQSGGKYIMFGATFTGGGFPYNFLVMEQ